MRSDLLFLYEICFCVQSYRYSYIDFKLNLWYNKEKLGGLNMTLNELVKEYQKRILGSLNKKAETAKIIQEIDKLIYTETNKPITDEDKRKILSGLQNELLNESILVHSQDNKEHLELINQAIKMLGGK